MRKINCQNTINAEKISNSENSNYVHKNLNSFGGHLSAEVSEKTCKQMKPLEQTPNKYSHFLKIVIFFQKNTL